MGALGFVFCVVWSFLVCFVRMSVRCQFIIIIIILILLFFGVCLCVCTGGVIDFPALQGKQARHGTTRRKVSTRRHLFFTGVLCVACRLCVGLFFFGFACFVSSSRVYFLVRLCDSVCVCVCAEVEQEQDKEKGVLDLCPRYFDEILQVLKLKTQTKAASRARTG